jgi:hypothetical protein
LARGDVADHFYKRVLNELERSDRLAELLALLCVKQCIFVDAHLASDSFPCNEAVGHAKKDPTFSNRAIGGSHFLFCS